MEPIAKFCFFHGGMFTSFAQNHPESARLSSPSWITASLRRGVLPLTLHISDCDGPLPVSSGGPLSPLLSPPVSSAQMDGRFSFSDALYLEALMAHPNPQMIPGVCLILHLGPLFPPEKDKFPSVQFSAF